MSGSAVVSCRDENTGIPIKGYIKLLAIKQTRSTITELGINL
jgi:hypothetical protein